MDVAHLDVRQPHRALGLALDDPAADPVAQIERQVGAVARLDSLRSPAAQLRVQLAGAAQVAGVQLEMDDTVLGAATCVCPLDQAGAEIHRRPMSIAPRGGLTSSERMSRAPTNPARARAASSLAPPRQGGESAFGTLVEPYRGELHAHCYRMLGSVHDAEDALQDTLLRAWRAIGRFEGRSSLRSWLYTIATNTSLNLIAKRPKRVLPIDYGPATDPHDGPGRADRRVGLDRALPG